MTTVTFSGPIFDLVDGVLRDAPEYRGFRAGAQSRAEFAAFLERVRTQLVGRGVPANDVHFAKRFPVSIDAAVEHAFAELAPMGLAWPAGFPAVCARAAARIGRGFDHQGLGTYIYPEEGRLLLAIALAFRPRNAVFLGSYYGYWAAWALPAIVACGARAVLVDPDPRVAEVARRSLARLYPGARVEIVCDTGRALSRGRRRPVRFGRARRRAAARSRRPDAGAARASMRICCARRCRGSPSARCSCATTSSFATTRAARSSTT
ncbi:putative leucine--tRNA ligase [Burkholderia pseudomallei MSHR684]|nr:putative leucine--tRNA ligase [Burkholderia pseudomallei MSHR684]